MPEFVGLKFEIHNGKKFIPITISDEMVGHKLGEFVPTRQFVGHTPADKKASAVNICSSKKGYKIDGKKFKKITKDIIKCKAIYKNLRSSPRKVNEILRSIRGKKADIAFKRFTVFRKKNFKGNI